MNALKPTKIKLFQGDGDDLDALHDQIADWLSTTSVILSNYSFSVHFHVEDRRWHILVIIMYQEPSLDIAVPVIRGMVPLSAN